MKSVFQIIYTFFPLLLPFALITEASPLKNIASDSSTVQFLPAGLNYEHIGYVFPGEKEETDSLELFYTGLKKNIEGDQENRKDILPPHELKLGLTGIYQGTPGGNLSGGRSINEASGSIDIEMAFFPLKSAKTFVHMESGKGGGLDGRAASLSGFNFDADDNTNLRVTELWYEQDLFEGKLHSQVGKVDLSKTFDQNLAANDETLQFLSPGFRNSPVLEFPVQNSLGVRLWYSAGESVDFGFALAEADADWNRVFDDLFSIIEVDLKPRFNEMQGNYRLYFWQNGMAHTPLLKPEEAGKSNFGIGLSADQELSKGLMVFSRFGWQRGDISRLQYAFSTGVQLSGDTAGLGENILGAAYGISMTGINARKPDSINFINTGHEHHIELYYNMKVNDIIRISPDIQWIRNLDADLDTDDLWAFGLRTQLSI